MRKVSLVAAVWALTGVGVSHGQMTYLSVSRVVRAETADVQTFNFSNPGEWNAQAVSTNLTFATASATQVGNLRRDGISFESHTAATNMNGFLANCSSDLNTLFTINAPTPYEIVSGPNSGSAAIVRLTRDTTTIFNFSGTAIQGTLQPGVYTFQVRLQSAASATIPDFAFNQDINFVLSIPAPGTVGAFALTGLAAARRRR